MHLKHCAEKENRNKVEDCADNLAEEVEIIRNPEVVENSCTPEDENKKNSKHRDDLVNHGEAGFQLLFSVPSDLPGLGLESPDLRHLVLCVPDCLPVLEGACTVGE